MFHDNFEEPTLTTVVYHPRNEHLNLLVQIKFLNLFLYSSK